MAKELSSEDKEDPTQAKTSLIIKTNNTRALDKMDETADKKATYGYSFMRNITPAKDRSLVSPPVSRKTDGDNKGVLQASTTLDTMSMFARFSSTNKNVGPKLLSDRDMASVTMSQLTIEDQDRVKLNYDANDVSSNDEDQRVYRYYQWWVDGIEEFMYIHTIQDWQRVQKYKLTVYSFEAPRLSLNFEEISPSTRLAEGALVTKLSKSSSIIKEKERVDVRVKKESASRNNVVVVEGLCNYFVGENGLVYMVPHNRSRLPNRIPNLKRIIKIDAEENHALALSIDGRVFEWGDHSLFKSKAPIKLGIGYFIVSIAAGLNYSMALTNKGFVLSWGENSFGQLGHSLDKQTGVTTIIPNLTNVAQISAGREDSVALISDGSLYVMGRVPAKKNAKGRTYYNTLDGDEVTLLKHNLALTSSGKVYELTTSKKKLISGDLNVVDICGRQSPYFLDKRGDIYQKQQKKIRKISSASDRRVLYHSCSTAFAIDSRTLALNAQTGRARWIAHSVKYNAV